MQSPKEINERLKLLQQSLKKKDRTYKRVRWIFKPFIIIAIALFLLSAILPILWPFTLPIIGAGVLAFLLRFLLYKYVFGDPISKFQSAFDNSVLEMLNAHGTFQIDQKSSLSSKEFDQIKVGIKKADGVYTGLQFSGKINQLTCKTGFIRAMNDSFSLAGFFQDAAAGILDDIAGFGIDPSDSEVSYSSDRKSIFKGWVTMIETDQIADEWMLVPPAMKKAITQNSRFVSGWKSGNSDVNEYTYLTQSGNIDKLSTKLLEKLQTNNLNSVILSAIPGKVFIVFPWRAEFTSVDLNDSKRISERVFAALNRQFEFINSCAKVIE